MPSEKEKRRKAPSTQQIDQAAELIKGNVAQQRLRQQGPKNPLVIVDLLEEDLSLKPIGVTMAALAEKSLENDDKPKPKPKEKKKVCN